MFGKKKESNALDYSYDKDASLMTFKLNFDSINVPKLEHDLDNILALAQTNDHVTLDFKLVKEMDTSGFAFIVALIYRLTKLQVKVNLAHINRLHAFAKLYDLEDYLEPFLVKN